ncbi:helix-turn-helix domain-containing protein [Kyrpidia spormannii]|uniref:helix-turn-helix domain-containing protein n=1 Tax=Kyrpidia spormannii TaxID=2055160 RepID=UPI0018E49805|nr:helix-turn-helix domain-containing protein [Kyrpidia spormannii]
MKVLQAYRFALDPSPHQERMLASHTGARRFAFNWGLALVKERLEARGRGEDVEVPWTLAALRREWNRQKEQVAPWWRENSKEAYSAGLDGLARGLKAFFDSRSGKRKGRRVGFPKFRKKGRGRESVRFTTGGDPGGRQKPRRFAPDRAGENARDDHGALGTGAK